MRNLYEKLLPVVLLVASCTGETGLDITGTAFHLSITEPQVCTRADTLLCHDSELLQLLAVSRSGEPYTKAAPVFSLYDRVGVYGYRYSSWAQDTPPTLLNNAQLVRNGSCWFSDKKMAGGKGGSDLKMRFYSYGPYDASGLIPACTGGAPTFKYTVPANVRDQLDIVIGESGELAADAESVSMAFKHVLSSMTFAVDASCSEAIIRTLTVKGVYGNGCYSPESGWGSLSSISDYALSLDHSVSEGQAAAVTSGNSTMMLIPQTFPEGASLVLGLEVEGEEVEIETSLSGLTIHPGRTYQLTMDFHVTIYDSKFTFKVDMNHKALAFKSGYKFWLPLMYFEDGTEELSVDWGDGTTETVSKRYSAEFKHDFPSGYVGDVVLKVKGTSPRIVPDGPHIQFIREIEIESNERYSSRNNCIVEDATSTLVYAGSAFDFPEGVTRLGPYCMPGSEISSLVVPEGISYVCKNAFSGPNAYLTRISIPSSVTTLEDGAFISDYLTSVAVSADNPVYYVDSGCIMRRDDKYVVYNSRYGTIPSDARGVRPYACGCSSSQVLVPDSCTDLMEYAFYMNTIAGSISLPEGCIIGPHCFEYDDKAVFTFRGKVRAGQYAFRKCSFTELDLSDFTSIGQLCFSENEQLYRVMIPQSYSIPSRAFSNCTALESLDIPSGCTIGSNAFEYCRALTGVSSASSFVSGKEFLYCSSLATLNCYEGVSSIHQTSFRFTPLSNIYLYCSSQPAVTSFEQIGKTGEVHVPSGQDYSSWMRSCGLTASGWTWTDDL